MAANTGVNELKDFFFDDEPVEVSKTADFASTNAQEIKNIFIRSIKEAFPDLQYTILPEELFGVRMDLTFGEGPQHHIIDIVDRIKPGNFSNSYLSDPDFHQVLQTCSSYLLILAIDITSDEAAHAVTNIFDTFASSLPYPHFFIIPPQYAWRACIGNELTRRFSKYTGKTSPPASPPTADHGIHMLADMPIEDADEDLLGFGDYADAIAGLIDHPQTKAPLTLAINAKWGMGKTSLANLIKHRLENKLESKTEKPHIIYWFNAWMHDDAGNIRAAFMADVVRKCNAMRPWWKHFLNPLPTNLCDAKTRRRRNVQKGAALLFISIAVTLLVLIMNDDIQPSSLDIFGVSLVNPWGAGGAILIFIVGILRHLSQAVETVSAFVKAPDSESNTGSLGEVRRQLHELIREVTPDGAKFVVFVDDMERCSNTKAIDVLEVVNQLLDTDPVVCIVLADMPALAAMAELKYKDLADLYDPITSIISDNDENRHSYGRLFLQKFIQLQFDLPEMPVGSKANFTTKLIDAKKTETKQETRQGPIRFLARKILYITKKYFYHSAISFISLSFLAPFILGLHVNGNITLPFNISTLQTEASRSIGFALFLMSYLCATCFFLMGALVQIKTIVVKRLLSRRIIRVRTFIKKGLSNQHGISKKDRDLIDTELGENRISQLIDEQKLRRLGTDSDAYKDARNYVMDHLPPHPRNIKRILNRLRLMLFLLNQRKLLTGPNAVPPAAIGKWILLQEKWPELEKRSRSSTKVIEDIEKANPIKEQLAKIIPLYVDDKDLISLLSDGHALGPSLNQIILLQP
ncbi:MAG: hypothetical protein JKY92_09390 [Magnetovibrio sp.]|nr:hypothetical protein [Magnetovibrio sp.]